MRRSTGTLRRWGRRNDWPELKDAGLELYIPAGRTAWKGFLAGIARPLHDYGEGQRQLDRQAVRAWVWLNVERD